VPPVRTFSLRDQAAWMREYYPGFQCTATNRDLRCTGRLQPTPLSREYEVTITCDAGGRPQAFVPGLVARKPDERIPHTYAPNRPCLYYPGGEWRSDMKVATTIVPWLSLWLYHYEVWHATGEWMGGGIHHNGPKN